MIAYLVNILLILFFGLFVISNYYNAPNNIHIENFDWYFSYIFLIIIFYWIYKTIQLKTSKDKVSFSPIWIFNYFLWHLFILCILFFNFNDKLLSGWILLFFKILWFLFVPTLIILISIWFWKKILLLINEKLDNNTSFQNLTENRVFSFLTSIWIWFFSFIFLLTTIWMLGFYNLWIVFLILFWFILISYKEFIWIFTSLYETKITFDNTKLTFLNLVSAEFFFLISTLVLSTSLINIVRPFPIWWDDLWVYMNYPHLLAEAGNIISLGWMYAWQTFTWIWYMLGSTTQAFFFNIIWWFLSFISIVLITSDLLKVGKTKKTFINIPMLVWTIFISMPMIVFQQAKDMKLDAWLFFVSIIWIYILFKYMLNIHKQKNILEKITTKILHHDKFDNWSIAIILIIGLLAWFAFSIKFTSLLLISAIIGLFSYHRLWILWFLAYTSIFFGIFTKANLWKYMNVVVNPSNIPWFETNFFIISSIIWVWLLVFSISKNTKIFKKYLIELWVFLIWVLIALSPWISKNIYDSYPNISIWKIITWTSEKYKFDKTKIYNSSELLKLETEVKRQKVTSSWITTNEDFWRYLWYEKWINNYMKLPWNLTMQNNQGWEFTDIWFIYLLFIPLILVFLPFKNKYYFVWIYALLLFLLLIFFGKIFTDLMSSLALPYWYLFIFLSFIIPTLYLLYTIKISEKNYIFKLNLVFASFYTFLWAISAFWIVWYWITMYFSFLLIIAFWFYYLSNFDEKENKDYIIKLFWTIILFWLILIYIFQSVIPHTFKNLKGAAYIEYKLWQINSNESPFLYHPEYLTILFELNIADSKKQEFILKTINNEDLLKIINNLNSINDISSIFSILRQVQVEQNFPSELKNQAKIILNKIFIWILNPIDEYKNKEIVYRSWTFLKYYISENNKRLYEDNLLFKYNDYIYDDNSDITIDRLTKLWLKYMLIDLNAATIDRDTFNHKLTDRYEKILKTFISDKIELVETDSVCLKLALNDYFNYKDIDRYMTLAWVNYESYDEDNNIITRWKKAQVCYDYILELRENDLINENNFPYLNNINNTINENLNTLNSDEKIIQFLHSKIWSSKKALFKIK